MRYIEMATRQFKMSSRLLRLQLLEVRQLDWRGFSLHIKAIDLNISDMEAEAILKQTQGSSMPHKGVPLTQSAATIANSMRKFTTRWPPLDKLLKGGIVHGHILELSGPPGCPKETIAIDITKSVLQAGESVIFVGTCAKISLLVHC